MTVPRGTEDLLSAYAAMVRAEAETHNLVSRTTLADFEDRHIQDSTQLLPLGPPEGRWLDLGSGAGLPGIVLAILGACVHLVESRRLRSAFLERCIIELDLADRVTLHAGRLETMAPGRFEVITARAFAPLPKLLSLALPFSTPETIWVLPKGRSGVAELAAARRTWQGSFNAIPSKTDPDATILVATRVARRTSR